MNIYLEKLKLSKNPNMGSTYLILQYKLRDTNTGFVHQGSYVIGTYLKHPEVPIVDLKAQTKLHTTKMEPVLTTDWYLYIGLTLPGPFGVIYKGQEKFPRGREALLKINLCKALGISHKDAQQAQYILLDYDYYLCPEDKYVEI